jgi:hypothetical protein
MTSCGLGHDVEQPASPRHRARLCDRAGITGAAAMVADTIFGIDAVAAAVS